MVHPARLERHDIHWQAGRCRIAIGSIKANTPGGDPSATGRIFRRRRSLAAGRRCVAAG